MSYSDHCPDRWEAEREGRRDAERDYYGYYRSPSHDHFDCDDAQRSYEDAYRSEMRHQEERREEREAEERADRRRAEEAAMEAAAEEAAYYQAMECARYQAECEMERATEDAAHGPEEGP